MSKQLHIKVKTYRVKMPLKKELNPVEADDLNDVLAVADVDLLSDVEKREEEFEAAISEDNRLYNLVFTFIRVSWKTKQKTKQLCSRFQRTINRL